MGDIVFPDPPRDLVMAIRDFGWIVEPQSWSPLSGGRTNRLWKFALDGQPFVCKFYVPGAATPLFPNDPQAEALALQALQGSGLAPDYCRSLTCESGDALIYRYVGAAATASPKDAGKVLRHLHRCAPPDGIRVLPCAPADILGQADAMLCDVATAKADQLKACRPNPPAFVSAEAVFLHGDPVPSHVIASDKGPCLIDWQCPAVGDPTEDLAIYLSPAMQHLYGGQLLDADGIAQFFGAYKHPERAARYRALATCYHYRMAAYCLWRAHGGDAEYAVAAGLETDRLKDLCQPDRASGHTAAKQHIPKS